MEKGILKSCSAQGSEDSNLRTDYVVDAETPVDATKSTTEKRNDEEATP
jgi:hypothetical protein